MPSTSVLGKRTRSSRCEGPAAATATGGSVKVASKRGRAQDVSAAAADVDQDLAGVCTRAAKRVKSRTGHGQGQGQFVILDEGELENPFVREEGVGKGEGEAMDVDDDLDVDEQNAQAGEGDGVMRRRGRRSAKGTATWTPRRIPLSPAKANSPVKTNKAAAAAAAATTKAAAASPAEYVAKTPSTPRHRDALATATKIAVTPRHRLVLAGRPPLTPRTPHTPSTPRAAAPTVYNAARQLFVRGAAPATLYERANERRELDAFVRERTSARSSGCIYVSGPPGTGKSAFVNDVCSGIEAQSADVSVGCINCMSIKSADGLYRTLLGELTGLADERDEEEEGDVMDACRDLFMKRKRSFLVTLDEVDHLLELDAEALYNIFEWALNPASGLVLVGIANALDFTDRFLPRLKARGLKPQLLPFLPYTAQQIATVVTSKLQSLATAGSAHVPFIHPTAITFLSKKVAAQSGDLRKALDICRRAIDLIEAETRDRCAAKGAAMTPSPTPSPSKTPLVENMNLSSPVVRSPSKTTSAKPQAITATVSLSAITPETAPRATIAHMARITAAVFSNGTTQRLQSLNLQQKAVLCSLSAMETQRRSAAAVAARTFGSPSSTRALPAAPAIKELFEAYTSLCRRDNVLHPLTSTEFRDIVGSLETLSLISAVETGAGGGAKRTSGGSLGVAAQGTPSRRGRGGGGFGGAVIEDRRVASVVGRTELESAFVSGGSGAAAAAGAGAGILRGILDGQI